MAYYDIAPTAALNCHFNLIFGERSNGKTTAGLLKMIEDYTAGLGTGVYIRQMDMDLKGQTGANVMNSLLHGGESKTVNLIEQASGGEYDNVKYYSRGWYLGKSNPEKDGAVDWEKKPFCQAMAISQTQHTKSATPPRVKNVVFDEFIPLNGSYLVNETGLFRQLLSTIVRDVDTVQVFMFANTITWNSPYFDLFGAADKVRQMEVGETIVVERKNEKGDVMRAAFEYSLGIEGGKKSDVFFIFDDESSAMITNGKFATPAYPRCPVSFTRKNVKATYWFLTKSGVIRTRLMKVDRDVFLFSDSVSDELYEAIKDDRRDLFYSMEFSSARNHFISPLMRYQDKRTNYLADAFLAGRMFFSTDVVGENLMYFAKQADQKSVLELGNAL